MRANEGDASEGRKVRKKEGEGKREKEDLKVGREGKDETGEM